ncbi:hypothetical protein FK85_25100 [Halorubrum saccharovorum]|uniref:Lipoprotein n=1 Tax=Halorubrum saccharovorum TaxID=2248 RepID=A0A0F8CLT4_9EURY|nr:hypothetical protein [Halorubrum saccharovorum]KKF39867.1 hypothetical protein FK85_25100 [Halorubrum saccharovorum]
MDRRAFLQRASRAVGTIGVGGGLAGCADLVGGGDKGGVAERDPPERPDELGPESVAEYVAAYEEIRTHNRHAAEGAVEVTVDAVATFDHASGDDHYATAQHAGSVSHENDDGDRSVGELHGDPVPYLVTPDRTLRLDVRRRAVERVGQRDGEGATRNGSATDPDDRTAPPLGVRLLNVTDEGRDLALTVTRRATGDDGGAGTDETVADLDVGIDPETAVEVRSVTDARGGYRVTARMEDDGVTGQGRIEVGLPSADRGANVDVVLDGNGVSTWHLPSFEGV